MKVLIVGNWQEGPNGWSTQLCNHILALDTQKDITVVPRRLNITGQLNQQIPPRILELEQNNATGVDLIILNTLPSLYERSYKVKTVAYYMCETSNFIQSGWQNKINIMDKAFVPCYANKEASLKSGVRIPVEIVPLAIDLSKATKQYKKTVIREQNPENYIFYTLSEWTTRKNIDAIIKAFHLTFSPREPVELLIKTTPVGLGDNPQQVISDRINSIKQGLKLYSNIGMYRRESIICGYASQEDVCSIHQSSDCYVNASRAEAFSIPTAEALMFGKTVISPNHTGLDYITEKNSYVVQSTEQPCFGANDTLDSIYCGSELWNEVNIPSMMKAMRAAYTNKDLNKRKSEQAKKDVQRFSFEQVGRVYRETLEKIL